MFQRAFSVSTREPAALLFAPGGHSPTGVFVAWCNVGTFVRLCFGVSCDICAGVIVIGRDRYWARLHAWSRRLCGHVVTSWPCPWCAWLWPSCMVMPWLWLRSWPPWPSVLWMRSRPWPWRPGRRAVAVAAVAVALAVFVSPSRGCDTPMNASVCNGLTESHYPDLRNQLVAYKMGANKQTTTKRKERYGSGYADRDGNPEAPKNRRHGRLKTEEWTRQGRDGLRLGMMHPHTMQG